MCVYIYIYTHMCVYICYVYVYICVYTYIYIYIHIDIYTYKVMCIVWLSVLVWLWLWPRPRSHKASYGIGPQQNFVCSGTWCFRMWRFSILVLNPSPMSASGVKSPHLQFWGSINYHFQTPHPQTHPWTPENLAQDKGGPSKGGFLNNILCSYTVLYYICVMKLMVCEYYKWYIIQESNLLFRKPPLLDHPCPCPNYWLPDMKPSMPFVSWNALASQTFAPREARSWLLHWEVGSDLVVFRRLPSSFVVCRSLKVHECEFTARSKSKCHMLYFSLSLYIYIYKCVYIYIYIYVYL